MEFPQFQEFKSIPRLSKDMVVTEKIDGSNGIIFIDEANNIFAGSRSRWLWGSGQEEIHSDNMGFAFWVRTNQDELLKLGPGFHYGEWCGRGIQRGYGLTEKRFYLFNAGRWVKNPVQEGEIGNEPVLLEKQEYCPNCCYVVPILFEGLFNTENIDYTLAVLKTHGSYIIPFMNPEGVVIYHKGSGTLFKKTFDDKHKGQNG